MMLLLYSLVATINEFKNNTKRFAATKCPCYNEGGGGGGVEGYISLHHAGAKWSDYI